MKAAIASLLLVTSLGAQGQVWVVADQPGPGVDHTEIQHAVDAASDGDALLVLPGRYQGFLVFAKSLAIAAPKGRARVDGTITIRGIAQGGSVQVRGLDTADADESGVAIKNCGGTVWIEDCDLRGGTEPVEGGWGFAGAELVNAASVVFVRCELRGGKGMDGGGFFGETIGSGAPGLESTGASSVAIYDSSLRGGKGGYNWYDKYYEAGDGGDGGFVSGTLYASGTSFVGGAGGETHADQFTCSAGGGDGGDGLFVDSSGIAYLEDSAWQGGPGGVTWCINDYDGAPGSGLEVDGTVLHLPGPARGLSAPMRAEAGSEMRLALSGSAGDVAALLVSFGAEVAMQPGLVGAALLDAGARVAFVRELSATGELDASIAMPALPAGVQGQSLFLQPFFAKEGRRASLGCGSTVLLVDPGL